MNKYVAIILAMMMYPNVYSQIKKMEPPFWWSNMNEKNLQILFYGENIASFNVESKILPVVDIQRTENPNYLFVTVNTEHLASSFTKSRL